MKFDTLITQYDKHNETNILLAQKFNIKQIICIISKIDGEKQSEIAKMYQKVLPKCKLKFNVIQKGEADEFKRVLIDNKTALINLSDGEEINSLIMLKLIQELNMTGVFVDLLEQKRYVFTDNYRVIKKELRDMSIEEIINLAGISIINESSSLVKYNELDDIINTIVSNLDTWYKYKQKLYDNNIFIHNYKDSTKVQINEMKLNEEEKALLSNCLNYLKKIGGISYSVCDNVIDVTFNNEYLKGFLFKSGTWLEVMTHKVVQSIRDVDDVKSGLLFSWSNESKEVQNELDVIAVRDSVLICISCKDSEKYDEDALNELQVYSEKLGGNLVKKILVSTKPASKLTIKNRAKEMGIDIVIVDKDINKFRKNIENIIKK